MKTLFTLLGLIMVIEGIPYFAFPAGMKRWLKMMGDLDETTMRAIGLASMMIGLIIVYITRKLLG